MAVSKSRGGYLPRASHHRMQCPHTCSSVNARMCEHVACTLRSHSASTFTLHSHFGMHFEWTCRNIRHALCAWHASRRNVHLLRAMRCGRHAYAALSWAWMHTGASTRMQAGVW
eukprot:34950-Chlamydomonas_euryale.AAC.1